MGIRWELAGTSRWLKAGLLGLACLAAAAQNISTLAGNGIAQFSGDGGPAASASLYDPTGVALDSAGNLYIADLVNNRVRKVSAGIITTVAGNRNQGFSGDGGPATSASMYYPSAVAVDAAGNLYIADKYNNRIRKVSGGIITTVAGNGTAGYSGDGGPATSASLYSPSGVAVDLGGNLYIADSSNSRIRKVSGGFIATVAGNGNFGFSGDGGPAASASLDTPVGVAVDPAGNLYIADYSRIRKVSGGTITTVAGNGTNGFSGDGGSATSASFSDAVGMAVDPAGNLYIADEYNNRIRKVSGGIMTTVAGNGNQGFSGDGGPAASASLNGPFGVAVDSAGNLYIADTDNNRIREVSAPGSTTPAITSVTTAYGGPVIAQNDFIVIKGANLVPSNTPAAGAIWSTAPSFASGQMPTQLGGVSVTVNNKPAFVYFYCSAATDKSCPQDQLNILTPLDTTTGSVSIVVTSGGAPSPAFTATMQSVAPSFLLFSAAGYIAATHAGNTLLGPTSLYPGSSTPAKPGEIITLYAVGFGLPQTPLVNGSAIQIGSLPVLPVCQVGGTAAPLTFAGVITPGLYQLNLTVPITAANGDNAVSCTYNGSTTPSGDLITVQSNTANQTLTITTSGTGSGTVTSSPPGTSCGSGCLTFPAGTVVTLTATPATGSTFSGWSGSCTGTGTCTVTMNTNQTVTATFKLFFSVNPTLTITTSGTGSGTVTSSPTGTSCGSGCLTFPAGTVVTLTATPATGSTFAGWSGPCSGIASCAVTMNSNQSVTATFNLTVTPTVPVIGAAKVTPMTAVVGTSTQVTVQASIADPSLIPDSVNLLQLNPDGTTTTLGILHDDGLNGDLFAGDLVFTLVVTLNASSVTGIQLQVSAAFTGQSLPVLSQVLTIFFQPANAPQQALAALAQSLASGDTATALTYINPSSNATAVITTASQQALNFLATSLNSCVLFSSSADSRIFRCPVTTPNGTANMEFDMVPGVNGKWVINSW